VQQPPSSSSFAINNNQETIQHSTMEVEEAQEELRIKPIPVVVNDGFKLPADNEEDEYEYQDDQEESACEILNKDNSEEEEEEESIGNESSSPIKKLTDLKRSFIPELKKVPERKLSPLLDRTERDIIWNNGLGHSLDSK
jgi:hypothetical protein